MIYPNPDGLLQRFSGYCQRVGCVRSGVGSAAGVGSAECSIGWSAARQVVQ